MTNSQSPTLTARLMELAEGWENESKGCGVNAYEQGDKDARYDCSCQLIALLGAGEATPQPSQIVLCADIDCARYQKEPTDRCVNGGHAYFVRPSKRAEPSPHTEQDTETR